MFKILFYLLFLNVIIGIYAASLFELLSGQKSRDGSDDAKNCICNGPSCICCLDFNVSFIDLGGPGCVRLNYISPEDGVDLNVSYGDSLLHSERVKGPDPEPTCLNLLSRFAQICARFHELLPTDDGLRGCLQFEPTLFGEAQLELPMGCFRMGPNGMKVIESSSDIIKQQQPHQQSEKNSTESQQGSTEIIGGLNAEDILAAVNESANQGIALLSNWLGLGANETNKDETIEETSAEYDNDEEESTTLGKIE